MRRSMMMAIKGDVVPPIYTGTMLSAKSPTQELWGASIGSPSYGTLSGTVDGKPLFGLRWGVGTGGSIDIFTEYLPTWKTLKIYDTNMNILFSLTGLAWANAGGGIYYAAKTGVGTVNPWPVGTTVYMST